MRGEERSEGEGRRGEGRRERVTILVDGGGRQSVCDLIEQVSSYM